MSKYSDVKKIISKNFPEIKIKSIKEFPEGYNNVAYDVKLSNSNYVVKLLKIKGYEKYVLKQNNIRTLIRKRFKNFPISKIVKSDFTTKLIDKPYIISKKIKGKSLLVLYDKIKNKEELYEEIGELYGKMHLSRFKRYGELDPSLNLIKVYKSWHTKKCKEVEDIFNKIENSNLLSKKTLKLNKKFFRQNKSLLKKEIGPCLCHGDASASNIIINKSNKKYHVEGLLDFEFARASGATHDLFSGLRSFDRKYKYRNEIVSGYTKWGKLPKEWKKLILLYHWIGHLNQLTRIKNMKWRNLNHKDTLSRKKGLRKISLLALKRIIKKLE